MIEEFKHWNKYSKEDNKAIWNSSYITFDTNILLGLYRISPKISDLFFELTLKIKERIFLPYQVAFEFHKNKINIISENISQLNNLKNEINKSEIEIKESKFINYFTSTTKDSIIRDINSKKEKIDERKMFYERLEKDDYIYDKISNLFKSRVEENFNDEEIIELTKKGEKRYSSKIPPGYEDDKKSNDNKLGDYFIWEELLRKGKNENKNILFVTNEKKNDWVWVTNDKKIIGPRPELKIEFFKNTNCLFQIISFENFIFSLADFTGTNINKTALKNEFKLESIFEDNFIKIIIPNFKNTENVELLQMQEEAINIQRIVDEIINKPEIDENQRQLLEDLKFRKKTIDETLIKSYSRNNK